MFIKKIIIVIPGILMDKTMDDKVMFISNDDKQNLKLLVETF